MGICHCTQRACERQGPEKRAGPPFHSTTETSTTVSKNKGRTGVLNLTKNCTFGLSTGTSSNCGTSTVVCTVTTRHQSLNNNGCHQLVQELRLCGLRKSPVQPSTNSEDRGRRGQGRRSNFPNRPTTAGLRLPRQPVTANGATTPGFSGPFPSYSGVFGPPPLFALMQSTLVRENSVWWQLGRSLFGMPAREL